ncbi:MAG: glutaredoxin [Pseudomonadota bacterium]
MSASGVNAKSTKSTGSTASTTFTLFNSPEGDLGQSGGVAPIRVTLYRWAGKWGPFKVNIPCGECTLTGDILRDTFETDLAGIPVILEVKDWLTNWPQAMRRGGWHAPIVLVEDKIIGQGHALNRGVLAEAVIQAHVARTGISGNVVFGKATCPHCVRAKQILDASGVSYRYHDVVREPRALYEMIPRVKEKIGEKTPVTVPQIWLNGEYVGGADQLVEKLNGQPSYSSHQVDTGSAEPLTKQASTTARPGDVAQYAVDGQSPANPVH